MAAPLREGHRPNTALVGIHANAAAWQQRDAKPGLYALRDQGDGVDFVFDVERQGAGAKMSFCRMAKAIADRRKGGGIE